MEWTVPAALVRAAAQHEAAAALVQPDGPRLTYRELHDQCVTVARSLLALGVRAGDRIGIWAPNTWHWVLAALGGSFAGGVLVPINTRYTGPEALDVLVRSGVRVLFVAGPFLGTDRLTQLRAAAERAGVEVPGRVVVIPVEEATGTGAD
ncbi:MAG TPA: AMP-binding protein, partial [Kineosporiaceae bacterium]